MKNSINIANVRPVWLRLMILILIAAPPLWQWQYLELHGISKELTQIIAWCGYAMFIWLFIGLNLGARRLQLFLSGAFVLALTTSFLGATTRRVFPFLAPGSTDDEISYRMALIFSIMIGVIPLGLLIVNSFSAAGVSRRVSRLGGRQRTVGVHGALALRVLQHVGEVFGELFLAWSEENPYKILPRYRRDWMKTRFSWTGFGPWFIAAVIAWCRACLLHVFEAIPPFVREFERLRYR